MEGALPASSSAAETAAQAYYRLQQQAAGPLTSLGQAQALLAELLGCAQALLLENQRLAQQALAESENCRQAAEAVCDAAGAALRQEGGEAAPADRQRTAPALQAAEDSFQLFITVSVNVVYKMSADWRQMYQLRN